MVKGVTLFRTFVAAVFLAAAMTACDGTTYPEPETPYDPTREPGGDGTGEIDPSGSNETYTTGMTNLSGLCLNAAKTGFYAAIDNGKLYFTDLKGDNRSKLPYSGSKDFEAITMDRQTGRIFLADEGANAIWELSADKTSVTKICSVTVSGAADNKGLEGVAAARDTLYIANQTPTVLIKYCLSKGQEVWRSDADKKTKLDFASYFSDICYDDSDNTLWIVDSKGRMVYHCNLNGKVLDSQSISACTKAEALVVDRPSGWMWIGNDDDGKIHRIKLTI